MIVGEFDVVDLDICNGLYEEMIMGLEVFYVENVWQKVTWVGTQGRKADAREELVQDNVVKQYQALTT